MQIRIGILGYLNRSVGIAISDNGLPPLCKHFEDGIDWRSDHDEASLVPKYILDSLLHDYARHTNGDLSKIVTTAITGYDPRFFGNRFRDVLRNNSDPTSTFQLSSLAEACHAGAFPGGEGILVRCGHGASVFTCVGRQRAITGGWGTFGGDEASGIWLGYEAVCCITALHDKSASGMESDLAKELLRRLEEKQSEFTPADAPTILEDLHLTRLIRGERAWKKRLYEIGSELVDVAQTESTGSKCALKIISEGQEHLVGLVAGGFAHAQIPEDKVIDICFSGSLFRSAWFKSKLAGRMKTRFPNIRIVNPRYNPVMGIALLALRDDEKVTDEECLTSFVEAWGSESWALAVSRE